MQMAMQEKIVFFCFYHIAHTYGRRGEKTKTEQKNGLAACPELPVAVYSTLARCSMGKSAEGSQELVAGDSAQAGGDGAVLGLLVCGDDVAV